MKAFQKRYFTKPENVYSPGYFWLLNGKLNLSKLCSQLDDMAAHGLKAVCLHPFPKGFRPVTMPSEMEPDYMSPEYMEILSKVMDHAAELGMNAWLYDEGGWPSGGCCGQVRATNPVQFANRHKFMAKDGTVSDFTEDGMDGKYAAVPCLIENGVTETFLKLTHEKWFQYCGKHFGKNIRFTFTDEPNMTACRLGQQFTWSTHFAEDFKKEKGYDITPYLPEIMQDKELRPEALARRLDYFEVRAKLFLDKYLLPIREWCRAHNLLSGGHLNGEDEPFGNMTYGYGHILQSLRALDVPGVDVIWRQLYPGNPDNRPFPMYAASSAHQNGSPFVLSESFGIYGDNMSPDIMKWLIDYQLVRGITVFTLAYIMSESAKNMMIGIAPNLASASVWDYMKPLYTYAAAIGSVLGNGTPATRTAVLYDIRAIWAGGKRAQKAIAQHLAVARKMLANQQEFDFVDDGQIANASILPGGALRIGEMTYNTLILPTCLCPTTQALDKMDEFRKKGGHLLGPNQLQDVPKTCRLTGRGKENIRVAKRLYKDSTAYFFTNESPTEAATVTITLPEVAPLVLCDTATGKFVEVPARGGQFRWTFAPYSSALFLTNQACDCPAVTHKYTGTIQLNEGWTMRRVAEYRPGEICLEHIELDEKEIPASCGDWRKFYPDTFSGKVLYTVHFENAKGGKAILDLGQVNYCASVKLNGKNLPEKFFGPFQYEVTLKKGENTLEILVANTMANVLSDPETRKRITNTFPPATPYEERIAKFNQDNHESGLFGPVQLRLL